MQCGPYDSRANPFQLFTALNMTDAIGVANAGSSSLKFSLFVARDEALDLDVRGQVESIQTAPRFVAKRADGSTVETRSWPEGMRIGHEDALDCVVSFLRARLTSLRLAGIGHRVVHGGMLYGQPVVIDAAVVDSIEGLVPLAPLHQPHNLAPIRHLRERLPELPQVACFDTSFHRSNPELAQRFALPAAFHDAGVRRYGFHGLSYEYIASVLPHFDPRAAAGRTIVLHLGNGSSMCALDAGRSVASTMGFTALEGLPMGTRCGSLDPGAILYLMDHFGMDARAVEKLLYSQSGLLGVSGISSDMRALLASDDTKREAGGRLVRLPDPPGARLAGRCARRTRRHRLHRRHRRERRRHPRARVPGRGLARRRARPVRQCRRRTPHQRARGTRMRVVHSYERGTDDCPAYPQARRLRAIGDVPGPSCMNGAHYRMQADSAYQGHNPSI